MNFKKNQLPYVLFNRTIGVNGFTIVFQMMKSNYNIFVNLMSEIMVTPKCFSEL